MSEFSSYLDRRHFFYSPASTDLSDIYYIDLFMWLFYMVLNELFLEVIILSQVAACTLIP